MAPLSEESAEQAMIISDEKISRGVVHNFHNTVVPIRLPSVQSYIRVVSFARSHLFI